MNVNLYSCTVNLCKFRMSSILAYIYMYIQIWQLKYTCIYMYVYTNTAALTRELLAPCHIPNSCLNQVKSHM